MDTFLKDLYREDMEKQAVTDQQHLYESLSSDELETLLGLAKLAVAGSSDAGAGDFTCPNCGIASGNRSAGCPTCRAASQADVSGQAFPKKTSDAELPTGKTASAQLRFRLQKIAAGMELTPGSSAATPATPAVAKPAAAGERGLLENLQRGWKRTGGALERAAVKGGEMGRLGFWQRPGAAMGMLGRKGMSMGTRLGGAGRLLAPHLGGLAAIAGGLTLGSKLLGGHEPQKVVYAEAGFLKMAAASVDGAPVGIRNQAAKLAASRLITMKE